MTNNNVIWEKFLRYLAEVAPGKIFVTKGVKTLVAEARKADPSDVRLEAIETFINIVSRPETQNERSKFTF